MSRSRRRIQALTLCAVAAVGVLVFGGCLVYATVAIVAPRFTLDSRIQARHQSNEAFWQARLMLSAHDEKIETRPDEEELARRRMLSYEHVLTEERRVGKSMLVQWGLLFAVSLLVFLRYWRMLRQWHHHHHPA